MNSSEQIVGPDDGFLRRMLERMPVTVYRIGPDGTILDAGGGGLDRFGAHAGSDLVGLNAREAFPEAVESIARAMAGESVVVEDHGIGITSGEPWATLSWLEPDPDRGGYVGFSIDMTDRYLAQQAHSEEAARYRLLAQNASDVVAIVDPEGVLTYVSPAVQRLTGRDPGELVGTPFYDLLHPDDIYTAIRDLPEDVDHPIVCEVRVSHATKGWVWCESVSNPVQDESSGTLLHLQASLRDVSERKRHIAELREASERADAASRAKSAFLSNMSQELRTPLLTILDEAESLVAGSQDESERDRADVIKATTASLLQVVEGILELAELEAGRVKLQPGPFVVSTLLAEVSRAFAGAAAAKGLRFEVRTEDHLDGERVLGDAERLGQALSALVDNAVKFTETGGVLVEASRDSGGLVRFTVTDTGPGIDEVDVDGLFEAFDQGARTRGGAGLGLAVARRLADLMGASLDLESAAGEGTTASLAVPLAEAPETAGDAGVVAACRILLADGNAVNRGVAARYLTGLGHAVETAATGADALRSVAGGRFDLVFVDCDLADVDGFEFARRIRLSEAAAAGRRLPIVALVLEPGTVVRDRCLASGMDDVVVKPYRRRDLAAAVTRWAGPVESGRQRAEV